MTRQTSDCDRSRERRAFAVARFGINQSRTTVQRANDTQATALAEPRDLVVIRRRPVRAYADRSRARTAASSSDRIADGSRVERTEYQWTNDGGGRGVRTRSPFVKLRD